MSHPRELHDLPPTIGELTLPIVDRLNPNKEEIMSTAIEPVKAGTVIRHGEAPMTPMEMLDRAVAQGASVDTLSRLMDLQERWETNNARKAFAEAMAAAKSEMPKITKNKKVDFTTSKGRTNYQYEDLASIMELVGPVLARHGLSVRYRTSAEPNLPITVTCIIEHAQGHHEENTLMAGRDDSGNKNSIQQIGSTVTYLQRYTLKAALGLAAAADDDGKRADDNGAISDGERQVILGLIEETGTDIQKFCEFMEINSISDLPKVAFKRAVAKLEAKKQKVAANG
jgi:hypothetical protein